MSAGTIERTPRTVVGVDGSRASQDALDWEAGMAEATGSAVMAIATWEWPRGLGQAVLTPADDDPAGVVDGTAEHRPGVGGRVHPGVELVPVVVEGRAADVLVEASRGADLLAVGSRGHGEVAGLLVGSVSEHCATHAHSPVLVVRNRR